jgi:hypothetical protein
VRDLVGVYYALIRALLRSKPHLRPCLKRCAHCRIFFFTHPCNRRRNDLRCGFGCRETHRRKSAIRRSVEFYRQNKDEKRKLNRRRYLISTKKSAPSIENRPPSGKNGSPGTADTAATPILRHVRMVVSLIEGRRVGLDEIVQMLARNSRQHSLARERRVDYVVRQMNARGS